MPSMDPEQRDALLVGTVLREFTIQAVIGHGGFGIVYRAEHDELELMVAIGESLNLGGRKCQLATTSSLVWQCVRMGISYRRDVRSLG